MLMYKNQDAWTDVDSVMDNALKPRGHFLQAREFFVEKQSTDKQETKWIPPPPNTKRLSVTGMCLQSLHKTKNILVFCV